LSADHSREPAPVQLNAQRAKSADIPKVNYLDNEAKFRWDLFNNKMAFEKLYEGIRGFAADGETLKSTLRDMLQQ
jgi:transaldolase